MTKLLSIIHNQERAPRQEQALKTQEPELSLSDLDVCRKACAHVLSLGDPKKMYLKVSPYLA